jgi:hypothetical protein
MKFSRPQIASLVHRFPVILFGRIIGLKVWFPSQAPGFITVGQIEYDTLEASLGK